MTTTHGSTLPSPDEKVTFSVKGSTRKEIIERIEQTMRELESGDYRISEIDYSPVVTYADGRAPNDWNAHVTCTILPEIPF